MGRFDQSARIALEMQGRMVAMDGTLPASLRTNWTMGTAGNRAFRRWLGPELLGWSRFLTAETAKTGVSLVYERCEGCQRVITRVREAWDEHEGQGNVGEFPPCSTEKA